MMERIEGKTEAMDSLKCIFWGAPENAIVGIDRLRTKRLPLPPSIYIYIYCTGILYRAETSAFDKLTATTRRNAFYERQHQYTPMIQVYSH